MIKEIKINVDKVENSCFVVMPFSMLYQIEYENIIKPCLEELHIKCIRGDEIYSKQRIMDDIWDSIKSCRFVIAELTGKNPNVLYEIGLAHAIGKPVIILTRNSDDVPFDLKDLRYLYYDVNDPFWGNNLKKGLTNLIAKVLENPEIDNYLSDITTIPKIDFPKISQTKPDKTSTKKSSINVVGNWKGQWTTASTKHEITLSITQNENDISAVGTITYDKDKGITVVQQIFEGKIKQDSLTIQGVNYTFIERGDSDDYGLDIFDLKLNKDKLLGNTYDKDDIKLKTPITLERI
ncbi:MAG: hypothetical protein ABGW88_18150 [Leeuwenhoekiella sp.]|mgnify:CR=1 FL=1|jgi:hypothetical protein|uniref:hypothetical protein n=1 Tax=Leeuwenhoekiella TaxID=283735 RepID=UPI000C4B7E30|nr:MULTISPECIES: hypothetical protein [Leeuwenhoekiella]MAO42957.1 hypothetical protein [Leeuwenhoekiella sp.]HCW63617.1 hypothetical protein [Leeuwenhoekiella sp.]|tara:strand:+ start:1727 stop:2605 length:879 start_codon:yes stop_codon:yes gene_type:complete